MRKFYKATMADRDHILADFQACTGLDDVETSIAILEQHDWKLMEAVQSVMQPLDGTSSPSPQDDLIRFERETQHVGLFDSIPFPSRAEQSTDTDASGAAGPSSVITPKSRLLEFIIEYRDQNIPVVLSDSETVGKIKDMISIEIGVPADKQELKGWVHRKSAITDKRILRDLNLPKVNTLFLLTPNICNPTLSTARTSDQADLDNLVRTYTFNITFRDGSKYNTLTLPAHGSKTVGEVKYDVYQLTDVPVRNQKWVGWPDIAKDDTITIAACHLSNYHALEMTPLQPVSSQTTSKDISMDGVSDDDDENVDSCALEEEYFNQDVEVTASTQPAALMPESALDEVEAVIHFRQEFTNRFGALQPCFYIGSLDDAIRESLLCRAKLRKPLALYLHHDGSILSNVFCSQALCSESAVNYLTNHFCIWPWDLTQEANRARLLTAATRHFGSIAAGQIRTYKPDQFPVVLIITRSRSTNEVFTAIQGHVTLDEFMTSLIHATEVFQEQQRADVQEEVERDARELIKTEQDNAYQMSLQADRAKAETQKRVEQQKQEEHAVEQQRIMEASQKQREEEDLKEAIRVSLARTLPDEPPEGSTESISVLRIRTPKRETLTRRFLASHPLQVVLNFLASQGYRIEDYKLITTYPRRDVSSFDTTQTLKDLKLFPQETLILEERS